MIKRRTKHIPPVQIGWRKWQELYDENMEALVWWQYLKSLNDIVLFIVPYIIAIFWSTDKMTKVEKKSKRKHRNL